MPSLLIQENLCAAALHGLHPRPLTPSARAADRYFGSFPKVGVVVPSPAAWLLPEFQDLSSRLTTTLDLPAYLPHGVTAEPTGDGFLIWLPSSAPPLHMLFIMPLHVSGPHTTRTA